jgi:hypothetical protein
VATSNWKSTAYTEFGCIRDYGAALAIVPAALWHSKPLFAPKALYFLVIDCPAFCTGVVIRGPKWRSQDRNVASGSGGSRGRPAALGGLMLPRDAAGELLADPQHALQVTYGCPAGVPGPQGAAVAGRIEALPQVEGLSNSG